MGNTLVPQSKRPSSAEARRALKTIAIAYGIIFAIMVLGILALFVYAGFTWGWPDAIDNILVAAPRILIVGTLVFFVSPLATLLLAGLLSLFLKYVLFPLLTRPFSIDVIARVVLWKVRHPVASRVADALLGFTQTEVKTEDREVRLKILIGAAFLADVGVHDDTATTVNVVLERTMLAPPDRELLKAAGFLQGAKDGTVNAAGAS